MISLYIDNSSILGAQGVGYLELDNPQITLNYECKSLKEPSTIKTPYTYSFSIPITKQNCRLLGVPHSTFTFNRQRIKATLSTTNPTLEFGGYIIVTDCSDTHYTINFFGNLSSLFYDLQYDKNGDKKTLWNILPSSISSNYIFFNIDCIGQSYDSNNNAYYYFSDNQDNEVLHPMFARYGYNNQEAKLVYANNQEAIDISSYDKNYGDVDSVSGKYLPYQFGDMRIECLQPIIPVKTFMSWITTFFLSKSKTFTYPSIWDNYGIALPLFTSLSSTDLTPSYSFTSHTNHAINFANVAELSQVNINFGMMSYYNNTTTNNKTQKVYRIVGSNGSVYTLAPEYNSYLSSGVFADSSFTTLQTYRNDSDPTYVYRCSNKQVLTLDGIVLRYTIYEYYQNYDGTTSTWSAPVASSYADNYWMAIIGYDEPNQQTYTLADNVGYWNEGTSSMKALVTIPQDEVKSGTYITYNRYFKHTESPLWYLINLCKAFGYHFVEYGNQIALEEDYLQGITSYQSSNPFTDIEITSVVPKPYDESALLMKFASNDDWFTKQYNELYSDNPLGSSRIEIDYDSNNTLIGNSDSVDFASTELKYVAFTSNVDSLKYYVTTPTEFTTTMYNPTIAYDASGNQVDLNGSLLFYSHQVGGGMFVSEGVNITSYFIDDTKPHTYFSNRKKDLLGSFYGWKSANLNYAGTVLSSAQDYGTYGQPKYYPTTILPTGVGAIAEYANRVSQYYSNSPLDTSTYAYSAKKVTFKCVPTGLIRPFYHYNVANLGIVVPIKVAMAVGNNKSSATVDALVYTSDPVYTPGAVTTYTVSVQTSHCAITGTGTYNSGSTVTLYATADSGYTITQASWSGLPSTTSFSADYRTASFTITSNVSATCSASTGTGYLIMVNTTYCYCTGIGNYNAGDACTLVAVPDSGYTLTSSSWSNVPSGATISADYTTVTFTVSGNATLTCVAYQSTTALVRISAMVAGTVTSVVGTVGSSTYDLMAGQTFNVGTIVQVVVTMADNYTFGGYAGLVGGQPTMNIKIGTDGFITDVYTLGNTFYTMTLLPNNVAALSYTYINGYPTYTASNEGLVRNDYSVRVKSGVQFSVNATSSSASVVVNGWNKGAIYYSGSTLTFTAVEDLTLTCQYSTAGEEWITNLKLSVDNSNLTYDSSSSTFTLNVPEHNSQVQFYPTLYSGLTLSNVVVTCTQQIYDSQSNAATSISAASVDGEWIATNTGYYDTVNSATATYTLSYPNKTKVYTLNFTIITESNFGTDFSYTDEGGNTYYNVNYGLQKWSTYYGANSTQYDLDNSSAVSGDSLDFWLMDGAIDYNVSNYAQWTVNDVYVSGDDDFNLYYSRPDLSSGGERPESPLVVECAQSWITINSVYFDSALDKITVSFDVDANNTGLDRTAFLTLKDCDDEIEAYYIIAQPA